MKGWMIPIILSNDCVVEMEVSEETDAGESQETEQQMIVDTIFGLFVNLSRVIRDDYDKSEKKLHKQVDGKLQRVIQRRKHELGINDGMTMQ